MLRDYQQKALDDAIAFIHHGGRRLFVAPCGTGKSFIEIALQRAVPGAVILTPRVEIAEGMIAKGGDGERIYTPLTYRNRLLSGQIKPPTALIIDEAHHDTCETADTIRLCLGDIPTVAFTATPFRGTPQGTAELRKLYGEPHYVLTLAEAKQRGLVEIPECQTVPVLDDDIVEISGGEFKVTQVEGKTDWEAAGDLVARMRAGPTVVCLSSVRAVQILAEQLARRGVPHVVVTGETQQRDLAFRECMDARAVMLQIQVVSEGVDLHVRTLIDLAPTTSPVKWLQQVGRAMRPGGRSMYACCNRNLLRHGYLFEGLLPTEAFTGAQAAFPTPSKRGYARAFGLEGVGRLKPTAVPLANGLSATAYYVTRAQGHHSEQYVAIVSPDSPGVLWATRQVGRAITGISYSKWVKCSPPAELRGFSSLPPNPLSPKQEAWWRGAAGRYGLDPGADVDAKTFAVLPVLRDLGVKIA